MRYVDRNYDLNRASMYGEPEISLDYNKNQWRYTIDQPYMQGVLLRSWMDAVSWAPYILAGVVVGGLHVRFLHNDKYNVFKKWQTSE